MEFAKQFVKNCQFCLLAGIMVCCVILMNKNQMHKTNLPSHRHITLKKNYFSSQHTNSTFKVTAKGEFTFQNMCIEIDDRKNKLTSESVFYRTHLRNLGNKSLIPKKLVVYGSKKDETRNIWPSGAPGHIPVEVRKFEVHFSKKPQPQSYMSISNETAFFATFSCPSNLYHVIEDTLLDLFAKLQATGRIANSQKQLYYHRPFKYMAQHCTMEPFEDFIFALGFEDYKSFHLEETTVCFHNAVFGYQRVARTAQSYRNIAQHIFEYYGVQNQQCGKYPVISIIQRNSRTIGNAEELHKFVLQSNVSKTVGLFNFEMMSVQKQMKVIVCTDILVGVQGAALEWFHFMKKGRGLLELAWPQKKWGFVYDVKAKKLGFKVETLEASEVKVNWDSFDQQRKKFYIYHGKEHEQDKQKFLKFSGPDYYNTNPWKCADGFFDKIKFRDKLSKLKHEISLAI